MKTIYKYTNYRKYLKDFYEEKKSLEGYTYRDFAKQAGMNSSSWLMHLIKGSKNLSNETAVKVAKVLGLHKTEIEYFEMLVCFTQAKTNEIKDHYYQKMIALKKRLNIVKISEEHYEYYTKWYHPVIRSLVTKIDFKDDYVMLAKKVLPVITPAEAKKSVILLEKLGFIKKDPSGKWLQKNLVISTGDEVSSLNVVNYHKQVCKLAEDAFDRSSREWRDISALTLGINKEDFLKIKSEIQAFRKKIMSIAQDSKDADRVYQLNFQFFPTSKLEENK